MNAQKWIKVNILNSQGIIIDKYLENDEITGIFGFSNKSNFVQQAVSREIQRIDNWLHLHKKRDIEKIKENDGDSRSDYLLDSQYVINKKFFKESKMDKAEDYTNINYNDNDNENENEKDDVNDNANYNEDNGKNKKSILINEEANTENINEFDDIFNFQGYKIKKPDYSLIMELYSDAIENLRAKIMEKKKLSTQTKLYPDLDVTLSEKIDFHPVSIKLKVKNYRIIEINAKNTHLAKINPLLFSLKFLKQIDLSDNDIKEIKIDKSFINSFNVKISSINIKGNPWKTNELKKFIERIKELNSNIQIYY